jgi:hypothetical protein
MPTRPKAYFERFGARRYLVVDAARRDKEGYFWVICRIVALGDVTTLKDPEVMKELEAKIAEEQAKEG